MREELRRRLAFPEAHVECLRGLLLDPDLRVINDVLDVVLEYGSPEDINRKAEEAGRVESLLRHVRERRPEYLAELEWLAEQRDSGAFVTTADYRRRILGERADAMTFDDAKAVTLEISSCHYFPWLMRIARRAIERRDLMPGRFVTVRNMREQEADGDLPAFAAAMRIIGASYVQQMETLGTDGSNIHIAGPETLSGYFGGMGQPNDYPLRWLDEFLYFYTTYGVRQVLNLNPGTVLLCYILHRLGIDIEFKISVSMGIDNVLSALWVLLTARLFSRDDGSTSLAGLNWSNSVTGETIEVGAQLRRKLGFEDGVKFEHHVTEAWKGMVVQPYLRRQEIIDLAGRVPNLSAKHEGGDPEVEQQRARPSDIDDYELSKDALIESGEWDAVTLNFVDKFDALNRTARALTEQGRSFVAARNLHHRQGD